MYREMSMCLAFKWRRFLELYLHTHRLHILLIYGYVFETEQPYWKKMS